MNHELEIDIDGERIKMDGRWMTHTELEKEITARVGAGNFHVADLSLALQCLEENLAAVETIELRMPPDVFKAFQSLGARRGLAPESLMRVAMVEYLGRHSPGKVEHQ